MELELGTLLKKARQEKGLSIEDIQTETKIRKKYIEAIENNEFDKLPGKVYLKVFIKGYAREVDINYQALLENYKVLNKTEKRKTNLDKDYLNGTKVDHKVNKKEKGSPLKLILIILLILFLAGLGVYTYQYFSDSDIRLLGEQNNIKNEQVVSEDNELLEEGAQSDEKIEDNIQAQTDEEGNNENNSENNSNINLNEETADNQLENLENMNSDLDEEELNKLIEEGKNRNILNSLDSNGISDQDTKIVTNETEDNLVEDNSSDNEEESAADSKSTADNAAAANEEAANDLESDNEQQNQTTAEQQENTEESNTGEADTAAEEAGENSSADLNQETAAAEEESSTENQNEESSAADNIALNAADTVWLTVSADGENVFSGIWEDGDQNSFEFEERLYIKIGNGSAITANVSGEEYGPWADTGEIAEVEFVKSDGEININNLRD